MFIVTFTDGSTIAVQASNEYWMGEQCRLQAPRRVIRYYRKVM